MISYRNSFQLVILGYAMIYAYVLHNLILCGWNLFGDNLILSIFIACCGLRLLCWWSGLYEVFCVKLKRYPGGSLILILLLHRHASGVWDYFHVWLDFWYLILYDRYLYIKSWYDVCLYITLCSMLWNVIGGLGDWALWAQIVISSVLSCSKKA